MSVIEAIFLQGRKRIETLLKGSTLLSVPSILEKFKEEQV